VEARSGGSFLNSQFRESLEFNQLYSFGNGAFCCMLPLLFTRPSKTFSFPFQNALEGLPAKIPKPRVYVLELKEYLKVTSRLSQG